MAFVVVLDACVLVPHPLFDTLLRAADAGLYEPRWSLQILDEVERTLVNKMSLDPVKAKGRIVAMQRAFPHAQVDGHDDLIPAMRNDPKDRHVLAAAVRAGAGAVVTANLKDFPPATLEPYAIEALHPDDFLLDLLDLDRSTVLQVLDEQARAYVDPPVSLVDLRSHLSKTVPKFAAEVEGPPDDEMPLPLEAVSTDHVYELIGGFDRQTPLSAVAWWWRLLGDLEENGARLLDAVIDPAAWSGGFQDAAERMKGLSMTTAVQQGTPPTTAWVMFSTLTVSTPARLHGPVPSTEKILYVEVAQASDGLWRVSGVVERPGGEVQS